MGSFDVGEAAWIAKLGNLRNTIRQELIGRHLDFHVAPSSSVLDVGCGQGTQGLRLMQRGGTATGVEQSSELLAKYQRDSSAAGLNPELLHGVWGTAEPDRTLRTNPLVRALHRCLRSRSEVTPGEVSVQNHHCGSTTVTSGHVAPHAPKLFSRASGGSTLHQLRHSALTHLGEEGVSAILLQAKSRHQDPRTLSRYAKPGIEAVTALTAEFDRGRRHRGDHLPSGGILPDMRTPEADRAPAVIPGHSHLVSARLSS